MKPFLALTLLSLPLLSGCAGLSDLATQLKGDEAIVVTSINTVYGTAKLTRVGGGTNSVTVSPDGTVTINEKR